MAEKMTRARIAYLRRELDLGRISYGELAEIEGAFSLLGPATLADLPENATAGDMLDELERFAPPLTAALLTPAQAETVEFYRDMNVPATWFIGEPGHGHGWVEAIALGDTFAWSILIEPDGTAHSSEAKLGEFSTGIEV